MLFNSFEFLLFLPVVFFIYWFVLGKSLKGQNFLLLVSSYFFYAFWDWRFLFLLMFSTLLDYFTGIKMENSSDEKRKRFWFWLSVIINLGFLGVFKYYNFFVESFAEAVAQVGFKVNPWTIKVILPVGISFYTFHGLSYVTDIYKGRIKAERNPVDYAVFVSFFPLLVAGPIERATHLLPQILKKREFSYDWAKDGVLQILWGLFKKVVIADNCSTIVEHCFSNSASLSSSYLILGIIYFAFQIYCDFSGYSDIAKGTAKLFGFDLMRNFAYPYFSRDIAEFWRRWHISLSTWFRDYVYIPLGGSQGGTWMKIRNTMIIFLISGFWHGANWTFIIWGGLNALYFLPSMLMNRNRVNLNIVAEDRMLPNAKEVVQILTTFFFTCIAWVFFRAASVHQAFDYLERMFTLSNFRLPPVSMTLFLPFIGIMLILEWLQRHRIHPLQLSHQPMILRYSVYLLIAVFTIVFGNYGGGSFIYFQF